MALLPKPPGHRVIVSRLTFEGQLQAIDPLLSVLDLSMLSHLSLNTDSSNGSYLESLFQHVGANLVKLSLQLCAGDWLRLLTTSYSTFWPNLKTIDFFLRFTDGVEMDELWSIALDLVRHAPQSLRDVRFHFNENIVGGLHRFSTNDQEATQGLLRLSDIDFKSLADALASHPDVTALRFSFSNEFWSSIVHSPVAEEIISSLLTPSIRAGLMLKVSVDTPAWLTGLL